MKENLGDQFIKINKEEEKEKQQEISAYVQDVNKKISENLKGWMKSEHNFYTLFPEEDFGDVWRRGIGISVDINNEKNLIPQNLLALYEDLKKQDLEVVIKKDPQVEGKDYPCYVLELNMNKY